MLHALGSNGAVATSESKGEGEERGRGCGEQVGARSCRGAETAGEEMPPLPAPPAAAFPNKFINFL